MVATSLENLKIYSVLIIGAILELVTLKQPNHHQFLTRINLLRRTNLSSTYFINLDQGI